LLLALLGSMTAVGQGFSVRDAQHEIVEAKKELDKVVTFCEHCRATGRLKEKPCPHCEGQGALLKCRAEYLAHKRLLEDRAVRAGARPEQYAAFDVAKRLPALEEKVESEALSMLAAYVGYLKVYNRYEKLLAEDKDFARKARQIVTLLDKLVDSYAARLALPSLKLLHTDDPVGKVGVFRLLGPTRTVRLEGENLRCIRLRTLKDYVLLVRKGRAPARPGYILAEIVGKQAYKTDDGEELQAILLQAY